jgi:co-chaperonin GroES (HSP10)
MKPILKNILFKPFERKGISEGGILIPDSFITLSNRGTVVEVGSKVTKVKKGQIGHRVGDWGVEVIIEGEKHFLMNEDAILATE